MVFISTILHLSLLHKITKQKFIFKNMYSSVLYLRNKTKQKKIWFHIYFTACTEKRALKTYEYHNYFIIFLYNKQTIRLADMFSFVYIELKLNVISEKLFYYIFNVFPIQFFKVFIHNAESLLSAYFRFLTSKTVFSFFPATLYTQATQITWQFSFWPK